MSRLRSTSVQRGDGPPVVFLHGYPLHHGMWEPQLAALSGRSRVILLDLPGYGLAVDRPVPETFSAFLQDVGETVSALLPARPVLVGHSFGGYLALGLYQSHPEWFSAMILADTRSEPDGPETREKRLSTAARIERPGETLNVDDVVRGLVAPATWSADDSIVKELRSIVGAAPSRSVAATLRAIADRPDLGPVLSQIRVPTLVLWGTDDQLIPPAQTEGMVARIRGSSGIPIHGAGHMPSLEKPGSFNDAVRSFLDRRE